MAYGEHPVVMSSELLPCEGWVGERVLAAVGTAEEEVRVKPWVCLLRVSYREDFVPAVGRVWAQGDH